MTTMTSRAGTPGIGRRLGAPGSDRGRGRGGFSLVEVMVAMLVLGVGVVGIAEGIGTALRSGRESQEQTLGTLYAAGLVETLRAEGYLTDGESQGEAPAEVGPFRWQRTISPAGIEGLHEVSVVVAHARTGRQVCELKTLLFEVPTTQPVKDRDRQRERDAQSRRRENRGGGR